MSAVRTLTALGGALGQDIVLLAQSSIEHLTLGSLASDPAVEHTLEVLLDRLCLSLSLAKPVGLMGWVESQAPKYGRAGIVDLAAAATHTLAFAAKRHEVDQRRVLAFLDVLTREIEQAALGAGAEQPNPNYADATNALLAMLAERDYGTCCHSKATAEWARRLGTALNCAPDSIAFIELCAVLHDIGKIATPDSILLKPGPLTAEEWETMRDHAPAGQRILNQIPSLQRCSVIVRAHHERYDGAGYPDGLAGMSIPFEARVVAVADAFHAMISERPYRKPIPPRQALQILEEGRGSQWDPDVVDAMLGMFSRRQPSVPQKKSIVSSA